jgi:hypothetical protein
MNLTNWHIDALLKKHNVKYIDLTKLISHLVNVDTKTESESEWYLIETIIYADGNLYVYISKENFESCILEHEPKMEMAG